jgi:hypothetical protein
VNDTVFLELSKALFKCSNVSVVVRLICCDPHLTRFISQMSDDHVMQEIILEFQVDQVLQHLRNALQKWLLLVQKIHCLADQGMCGTVSGILN